MSRGFPSKGSGFRSQLEEKIAAQLDSLYVKYRYEEGKVPYIIPASKHAYSPDFVLPNGIIIEAKGLFEVDDRKKHLLIKAQHPDLDIRFVFSSSRTKISSGSKTTVAEWSEKNGYLFAEKLIPKHWLKEPSRPFPPDSIIWRKPKED